MKKMTAQALINALSKVDPNAVISFNIHQYNERNKVSIQMESTIERDGYEFWIGSGNNGYCFIDLHLPEKAIVSRLPKKK